jgi:hydroxyacylglutathione hydrolase
MKELVFEQIRTGGDRNFGYLLGDRDAKTCVLIDPSYTPEVLVERAKAQELKVTHILNTHGHHDHINGNLKAMELTGAQTAAHPDCPSLPDIRLQDESTFQIGSLELKVLYTPGHCEDHIVFYEPKYQLLISGDLLFVGKVGGTSSDSDARVEFNSLRRMLNLVPETATVWPGHDYGVRPSSTLAMEKACNPFLQPADVAGFLRVKDDWAIYKKLHGLK